MTASTRQRNPYIIGRPITEPKLFFGRNRLFQFIEDNLAQGAQVILLHGQRRIGKSSVLTQIPNFVKLDSFIFVSLSLEGKGQKRLHEVLYELAKEILHHLDISENKVPLPLQLELENSPDLFTNQFLSQVRRVLDNAKLVLLLDEFDALGDYTPEAAINHFFPYLQSAIRDDKELFIIPVIGRRLDDLPTLLELFREAPNQEVGLLDRQDAEQLIIEPAKELLQYDHDAINAVLELTSGHPYFTQLICFAIFTQARETQQWQISRTDVEGVADRAIELGEGGLAWFRDGLPIPERVVFSAVANSQESQPENFSLTQNPLDSLEALGVCLIDELNNALPTLIRTGLVKTLNVTDRHCSDPNISSVQYIVAVEIVRRWLLKRHDLQNEIKQLEHLDEKGSLLYEEAVLAHQEGRQIEAKALFESVLFSNPNCFRVLPNLVDIYISNDDFDEAIKTCERIYKFDSFQFKDKLVDALSVVIASFLMQGEFERIQEPLCKLTQLISFSGSEVLNLSNLRKVNPFEIEELVTFLKDEYRALKRFPKLGFEEFDESNFFRQALDLKGEILGVLRIKKEQEQVISSRIHAWQSYQGKIDNYRQSLLEATYRDKEYPLTVETREKLLSLQEELGIGDKDIEMVMEQFNPRLRKIIESSKNQYRQQVERFSGDGQISSISRRILDIQRDKLRLLPKEAEAIEKEILTPHINLQQYEEVFRQAIDREPSLSLNAIEELQELQRILAIKKEDSDFVKQKVLSEKGFSDSWLKHV